MQKSKIRHRNPKHIIVNNINIKQFIKFSAVFSALSSLFLSALFGLGVLLGLPAHTQMMSAYGVGSFVLVFVFYFLSIFVSSLAVVWLFDVSARLVGGIKIEIGD